MEKSFLILSVLMLTLINFLHVPSFILGAQADINIACGATYPFTDSNGNYWVGDDQFIQAGSIATVQIASRYSQILSTVRYFSDGNTNCYAIPGVTQGNKIKVVAIFQYGNYDNLALPPSFGLQIDGSKWAEVETSMDLDLVGYEMTYWAVANMVSVCLAPDTTARAPFISAIQIMEAPPSPSTEAPPSPSTEAPPSPSTGNNGNTNSTIPTLIGEILLAAAKASAKASAKGKFRGFIYLVTLLPGGTFVALVASVITCIKKRKKDKKAHTNNNSDAAAVGNQQTSEPADETIDEVQGTNNRR